MMAEYIITLALIYFMCSPAHAEPPIHNFSLIHDISDEPHSAQIIHDSIQLPPQIFYLDDSPCNLESYSRKAWPKLQKTKWQILRLRTAKNAKLLIRFAVNGAEVAGSVAQILQYAHH